MLVNFFPVVSLDEGFDIAPYSHSKHCHFLLDFPQPENNKQEGLGTIVCLGHFLACIQALQKCIQTGLIWFQGITVEIVFRSV